MERRSTPIGEPVPAAAVVDDATQYECPIHRRRLLALFGAMGAGSTASARAVTSDSQSQNDTDGNSRSVRNELEVTDADDTDLDTERLLPSFLFLSEWSVSPRYKMPRYDPLSRKSDSKKRTAPQKGIWTAGFAPRDAPKIQTRNTTRYSHGQQSQTAVCCRKWNGSNRRLLMRSTMHCSATNCRQFSRRTLASRRGRNEPQTSYCALFPQC